MKLQYDKYEKEQLSMMDLLNISTKNQPFIGHRLILQAIRDLKESREQTEIAHYGNAASILESM